MNIWWQVAIGLVVLYFVSRFVLSKLSRREPEPSGSRGDPLAGVPAPKKRGPPNRAGAVALAEPDEDDEPRNYPQRSL